MSWRWRIEPAVGWRRAPSTPNGHRRLGDLVMARTRKLSSGHAPALLARFGTAAEPGHPAGRQPGQFSVPIKENGRSNVSPRRTLADARPVSKYRLKVVFREPTPVVVNHRPAPDEPHRALLVKDMSSQTDRDISCLNSLVRP